MLREAVTEWRLYPVIEALQAMRGIQFITAVGLISELGDLTRFEHPRQLMSWFGITPQNIHPEGAGIREASLKLAIALPESCWSRLPGAIGTRHASVLRYKSGRRSYPNPLLTEHGMHK